MDLEAIVQEIRQTKPDRPERLVCIHRSALSTGTAEVPCNCGAAKAMRLPAFHCAQRGADVSYRDCVRCEEKAFAVDTPDAPLVFWVRHPNYRSRQTMFFAEPLAAHGIRIVHLTPDDKGIEAHVAEHGMPDAVLQWEEHGCGRCTAGWRDLARWCYANDVVPMSVDYGYFDHYRHYLFDLYLEEPFCASTIEQDWAELPDTLDWNAAPFTVRTAHAELLKLYEAAREQPPLIEGPYICFWLQQAPSLMRFGEWRDNQHLAEEVCRAIHKLGFRPILKGAPSTPPSQQVQAPDGAILFHSERQTPELNARLAVHAHYCLTQCSSITNEWLQVALPVVTMGRSWFNDHGVFHEIDSLDELTAEPPPINEAARARYANWWLRREFQSPDSGPALTAFLADARKRMAVGKPAGTVVTCIYAPDEDGEREARDCVEAVVKATPGWQRIVAVDAASPAFTIDAMQHGEVIALRDGQPPRMGRLMETAVEKAEARWLLTVEQDARIGRRVLERAVALLDSLPRRVAGISVQSVDDRREPTYPWTWDWPKMKPWARGLRVGQFTTLSTTLWRTAALREIDWRGLPSLEAVDMEVGARMHARGQICAITADIQALHRPHGARRLANGPARCLAIGANPTTAERALRFGWAWGPDVDVAGHLPPALPFDADSFREIVVGNLPADIDADGFLAEAWRVLRRDGRLRLLKPALALADRLGARWEARRLDTIVHASPLKPAREEGRMHASSWYEMGRVLKRHLNGSATQPLAVLDVGSRSVNLEYPRTYRELMAPAWRYSGCDTEAGENVDDVQADGEHLPYPDATFDAVLSGQCLEHVERPWLLVPEMARVLRPGGLLALTAPWQWDIHRYPVDCWRVLPDGMARLIRDAGLDMVEAYTVERDCWGIGRKPV